MIERGILRHSDQAKITSPRNGVLSGGHVELSENALDMRFDGVERDVELVADLSLREVGPEQPEHGQLSITELYRIRQL
jgi:hypothetical protein